MASVEKIELEIVTPERLHFSGEVDQIVLPGAGGYLGILPGHAPLLSELSIGVISYRQDGNEGVLFCRWGFAEILPDRVTVLAEVAESPDRIDIEETRAEKRRIEAQLEARDEEFDYGEAMDRWQEAQAKLEVAEKGR